MKKYDINKVTNGISTKVIRVKLQIDEYVGYLKVEIGGNTSPLEAMNRIIEEIVGGDIEIEAWLNPGFEIIYDQEIGTWFQMTLKRPDGKSCTVEDEFEMLKYYATEIELVNLKEKE